MIIRAASEQDLPQFLPLVEQLGYPQSLEDLSRRFHSVITMPNEQVLIAAEGTKVLGFIHFGDANSLVDPEAIEIRALVVDEGVRGKGIGRTLMAEVEKVAREIKLNRIRFSSNIKRERAHQLYLSLGYEIYKTSYRFIKNL